MLIIVLPVLIVQLVSSYVFYQNHIQKVVRKISNDTIQKIVFINNNYKDSANFGKMDINPDFLGNINIAFLGGFRIPKNKLLNKTDKYLFFDQEQFFIQSLLNDIKEPIAVDDIGNNYVISIQKKKGVLNITVAKKDLIVKTANIFMTWNIALSVITLLIAILFMKNQLKPINLLKKHVKKFSLNQNMDMLKPTGSAEIRDLTISFMEMEKRLKKFINQRTIMLAGISHDLRTPLTRMKLELEMMNSPSKKYLAEDIEFMEKIVNQYLAFTKNIKDEDKISVNVFDYINDYVREYKKINKNISLKIKNLEKDELILIQQIAFKRVLNNIVANGLKFGTRVLIEIRKDSKRIFININDNGCGVKEEFFEKLTEPFFKIDESRNIEQKGVGLGLAVAKEIILANNGTIKFAKSKKMGGLKVEIGLKIEG
ncbi:MAG TPA: ATP-binding protein [Rickettsiales bacterium]|nr:ATP-binding protein [Rickettsiales bacterium]